MFHPCASCASVSGSGLYMSGGVGFDSAFQIYSFSGMPIAGAATALGYLGGGPFVPVPY